MLGSQSVARYRGWKPTPKEIERENEINREIGAALNAWKNSTLVADEAGLVNAMIEKRKAERGGYGK
jgi:hypothetical protein